MGQTLQNCGIGESEEDKKAREEEEKRAAKEKAAREKAAEEKFQRSEKLESDIIARVEAAENKITKNYGGSGVYCGQMEGGKRHGYGTFTYANGKKYVGEYKNGNKHGQGTLTLANGTIKHSGKWKKGKPKNKKTFFWCIVYPFAAVLECTIG